MSAIGGDAEGIFSGVGMLGSNPFAAVAMMLSGYSDVFSVIVHDGEFVRLTQSLGAVAQKGSPSEWLSGRAERLDGVTADEIQMAVDRELALLTAGVRCSAERLDNLLAPDSSRSAPPAALVACGGYSRLGS